MAVLFAVFCQQLCRNRVDFTAKRRLSPDAPTAMASWLLMIKTNRFHHCNGGEPHSKTACDGLMTAAQRREKVLAYFTWDCCTSRDLKIHTTDPLDL